MASYTRSSLKGVNMDYAKQVEMDLEENEKRKLEEKRGGKRNSTKVNNALEDDSRPKNQVHKIQECSTPNQTKISDAKKIAMELEKNWKKRPSEEVNQSGKSSVFLIVIPVIVVLLAVGVVIYFQLYNNQKEEVLYPTPKDLFLTTMQNLKEQFPEITPTSIFMINYTILSMIDHNDPRSPATVLLLGTKGKKLYTDRVLHHLMAGLSVSFGEEIDDEKQFLDFEQVDKSNSDRLKLDISLKLDRAFENEKYSFLAMKNVDKAPWDVVSTLHPYFDHENAPYKRVVYLCTATTNDNMKEEDLKEYRRLAENLFDVAWQKYHSDHRDAMYSRLFTSIAAF